MREFDGRIDGPALLYVNVDWCGYCKRAKPMMDKLSDMLGTAVPVISVNGDRHKAVTKQLGVTSFPTILYIDPQGAARTFDGERTIEAILGFVCTQSSNAFGICKRR